jgi:DNA-binding response OmpR family regulator
MTAMDTILVVDDDRGALLLIETILSTERHRLLTATTAEAARAILAQEPDRLLAILLDWDLPDTSGIELLEEIKDQPALTDTPVIMETAMDSPAQIRAGIDAGAFYYLTKPFDRSVLLSIIRAAVSDHRTRRSLAERLRDAENPFSFLKEGTFRIHTIAEAERLALWIANSWPDPTRAMQVSELMINGVEHGNLGITYEDKGRLLDEGTWDKEIERRLALPENQQKFVSVSITRHPDRLEVLIRDEGKGFDFEKFLTFDENRVFHNHGRGIAMARCCLDIKYRGNGNTVLATVTAEAPQRGPEAGNRGQ